jgi:hypothetical protein
VADSRSAETILEHPKNLLNKQAEADRSIFLKFAVWSHQPGSKEIMRHSRATRYETRESAILFSCSMAVPDEIYSVGVPNFT